MPSVTKTPVEVTERFHHQITDDEAAAMFRVALNLFNQWELTERQAAILLNLSKRTLSRCHAGKRHECQEDWDGKAKHVFRTSWEFTNRFGLFFANPIVATRGSRHRIRNLMADPRSMSCLAERWVIYCECGNCLKLKS